MSFTCAAIRRLALGASLIVLASASAAQAQVVERNLPPAPQAAPPVIVAPNAQPGDQNATPIGPPLRAIVLLDAAGAIRTAAADGVDAAGATRLKPGEAEAVLRPFLGRPLSRKLIAEAEAQIARLYRKAGYPFVSVSTPEQEITSGVLQIRVIEFKTGKVRVIGARSTPETYIRSRVRTETGDAISAPALSEDLDWLNRYPFRQVTAVFTPGADLGQADLKLNVQESRPWSAYVGYANSGEPFTGMARYFAGAQVGGLLGRDSLLSYQLTASSDALLQDGDVFGGLPHPRYLSHALSLIEPASPRSQFEISVDRVETNLTVDPFGLRQTTLEGSLGYRFALSNLAPGLAGLGDVRTGVQASRQRSATFFSSVDVNDVAVEIYEAFVGYHRAEADSHGTSDLDLLLHLSPGGMGDGNSAERVQLYTQGRVTDARFAYLSGVFKRETRLPHKFRWVLQVSGQYSAEALPGTDQSAIGQDTQVRGYSLDDGSFDRAIIVRDELHAPIWGASVGRFPTALDGFAFVDAGAARDVFHHQNTGAVSTGLGANYQLGGLLTVALSGACALKDAPYTHAGDWRLQSRITVSF